MGETKTTITIVELLEAMKVLAGDYKDGKREMEGVLISEFLEQGETLISDHMSGMGINYIRQYEKIYKK